MYPRFWHVAGGSAKNPAKFPIYIKKQKWTHFALKNRLKCVKFFQLWVYFENKIKGDEHQCLTAAEISGSYLVQLKECTETEKDIWDYNDYVRKNFQKCFFHVSFFYLVSFQKKTFVHRHSKLCLDKPAKVGAKDEVQLPTLSKCARDNSGQRWNMISVDWLPKWCCFLCDIVHFCYCVFLLKTISTIKYIFKQRMCVNFFVINNVSVSRRVYCRKQSGAGKRRKFSVFITHFHG